MESVTTRVAPNIVHVRLPVPFPLKFVNCYLIEVGARWVLVDAGLRYPKAEQAWDAAFDELGITADRIAAIYVTHYHPDHFGMAGLLQQRSGAPVYMSSIEAETVKIVWPEHDRVAVALADFFQMYGMPAATTADIAEQMRAIAPCTHPLAEVTPLADGAPLPVLDGHAGLVYAGHTDGHLCLYSEKERVLLSGDHILPKITPNISFWPTSHPNPLGAYLESLPELDLLDVSLVLPSHGPVFGTYHERIAELQEHHAERLEQMLVTAGEGRTAFEICDSIFNVASLSPHQARFAMAETLSHLVLLVNNGRMVQDEHRGQILFRPL